MPLEVVANAHAEVALGAGSVATSSSAVIGEPRGSKAAAPQVDATPIILTSATVITTPAPAGATEKVIVGAE